MNGGQILVEGDPEHRKASGFFDRQKAEMIEHSSVEA